ncbi:hypothetical protein EI555_016074, partial [Monodon monoceros]
DPVTIILNFSLDKIHLIEGGLEPFNPGLPVQVPLWLAINLKQRQKCRLLNACPTSPSGWTWKSWRRLGIMNEMKKLLPPLLHGAHQTPVKSRFGLHYILKADEIWSLIKDVRDTRIAKLRVSANSFMRQQEAHAKLDNLTLTEINTSGAFLTQALDHM